MRTFPNLALPKRIALVRASKKMTRIQTVIKLLEELKDRCDGTDKITPEDMQKDIDTILIHAREADIPPMLEIDDSVDFPFRFGKQL
jgi:hypothetical protein